MNDIVGRRLAGRYFVETLIGRGGMAEVYLGNDTMLERAVAVKVLTDRSEAVLRRFLREAQSMAKLNHRNIVAVHDAGQDDGISYIVMELVAGRTLAEIPGMTLSIHTAIRYFIDLLEALAYAHEQDVIHRDVKPANVMVLDDGSVKVMDFGLSRRTSELSNVTNAGEIVGTIAYLAPERFLGKVADARSDLYSVGIVMYEVFTGTVPFKNEADDLVAIIFAHVNETPPSLRTINRAIPQQIDRIVLKLLEKDVDLRYQTARDVIVELQALIGASAPLPAVTAGAEGAAPTSAPMAARTHRPAAADVRSALDRTFGSTATLNEGYASTLAGMLAARKRDYPEAIRAYNAALGSFKQGANEVEHAKTAIKYGAMILQKNSEVERPARREVDEAVELVNGALQVARGRRMLAERADGERILYALQRIAMRLR